MPKITDIALEITECSWRIGLIDENDCFNEVLEIAPENGFRLSPFYKEVLSKKLCFVVGCNGDQLIDETIKQLSKLRSRRYPTV